MRPRARSTPEACGPISDRARTGVIRYFPEDALRPSASRDPVDNPVLARLFAPAPQQRHDPPAVYAPSVEFDVWSSLPPTLLRFPHRSRYCSLTPAPRAPSPCHGPRRSHYSRGTRARGGGYSKGRGRGKGV